MNEKGRFRRLLPGVIVFVFLLFYLFGTVWAGDFSLTIVHINDTHSHLDSEWLNLKVHGQPIAVSVGGMARVKSLIDSWRKEDPHLLTLHAGDVVQGTLYFSLFDGTLEFGLLNALKLNCLVMGNHEFDRGIQVIPRWIKRTNFPWVTTNIDFSRERKVAALVKPYVIKEIKGEKIGIIGLTTEKTPFMVLNIGETVFADPIDTARKYVAYLTAQGVNKIIVLSHLGYNRDCELAALVPGIDIIVGGHSHSLLGSTEALSLLGLTPEGPYPTEVKTPDGSKALVVQAWRWAHVVGKLKVVFSSDGKVKTHEGSITLPVGKALKENGKIIKANSLRYRELQEAIQGTGVVKIVKEDEGILKKLTPYRMKMERYKTKVVGWAEGALDRGLNKALGSLVADAMRAKFPGVHVALYNSGGVRKNLSAGKITLWDVFEVLPFGNTLVLVDLKGKQLKEALEEGIDFLVRERGRNPDLLPYVSGMKIELDLSAPAGERIKRISLKEKGGVWVDIDDRTIYRVVVNSFMAAGGDGFLTLRKASLSLQDTGIFDREAFIEYLKKKRTVTDESEKRVVLINTGRISYVFDLIAA